MVPSSSGLGRLVLIQKIAGSTPAGITKESKRPLGLFLISWTISDRKSEPAQRVRPPKADSELQRASSRRSQQFKVFPRGSRAACFLIKFML